MKLSIRLILFLLGAIILLVSACQPQPPANSQVFVEADGQRQALPLPSGTVREALAQAGITVGKLDRVKPDLYTQLTPGLVIVVTRVTEELVTQREVIPYPRQTVINEALAAAETRLAQLGVNGEDEVTLRVVSEDGQEVSRTEIARTTLTAPVPEIMVIGPQGDAPAVAIEGTIAYISNGDAWLMRDANTSRRGLTSHGQLDERVFALSPDSRQLLYTIALTNEIDLPLNELWLASTTIVGEPPITIGLRGVLNAAWSPVVSPALVAFSTAERSANPPGWQAHNDLWLVNPAAPAPVEVIPRNTNGQYPWWGTTLAWSPDGQRLAYARADQIGVISLITTSATLSAAITPLIDFPPLDTFSDWVWTPGLSWSPDGRFIAAVTHGLRWPGNRPRKARSLFCGCSASMENFGQSGGAGGDVGQSGVGAGRDCLRAGGQPAAIGQQPLRPQIDGSGRQQRAATIPVSDGAGGAIPGAGLVAQRPGTAVCL
jgi:hypothetical protein